MNNHSEVTKFFLVNENDYRNHGARPFCSSAGKGYPGGDSVPFPFDLVRVAGEAMVSTRILDCVLRMGIEFPLRLRAIQSMEGTMTI